jgi:hypothetical protein
VVVLQVKQGYAGSLGGSETWAVRVDPTQLDVPGTTAHGVSSGTTVARTGAYDPAWYTSGWPTPDPSVFASWLSAVADNEWTEVEVPNRPAHNHDWGTVAIDPARQVLLRFSGGHSAHSGTEVLEYDMVNNRYRLSYAPEIPIDFEYTNDQVPGQWSFDQNPWMAPHTYKIYAYSAAVNRMVLVKTPYTYYYDLDTHDWEAPARASSFGGNQYENITVPTPTGMMLWNNQGLFTLDIAQGTWSSVALSSGTLPYVSGLDGNTAVWDSTRGRLLLFAAQDGSNTRGQVWAVSGGVVTALDPTGLSAMNAGSDYFHREAVYVPSLDAVLLGTTYDDGGVPTTPVYHCAENRWYAYHLGALQEDFYGNSLGLALDASERVWAVNTASRVMVLTLNASSAVKTGL